MDREIVGKRVRLRMLRCDDLADRARWTADDDLAKMMGIDIDAEPFISPAEELRGNEEWFGGRQRAGALLYAIEVNARYIGDIDVTIDSQEQAAILSVFIGDRSQWGRGYGSESVELLLRALSSAGEVLTVLATNVAAGNTRAHRFWRRLGFEMQEETTKATTYALTLGKRKTRKLEKTRDSHRF